MRNREIDRTIERALRWMVSATVESVINGESVSRELRNRHYEAAKESIKKLIKQSYDKGYQAGNKRFNTKEQRYMSPSEKAFLANRGKDA